MRNSIISMLPLLRNALAPLEMVRHGRVQLSLVHVVCVPQAELRTSRHREAGQKGLKQVKPLVG